MEKDIQCDAGGVTTDTTPEPASAEAHQNYSQMISPYHAGKATVYSAAGRPTRRGAGPGPAHLQARRAGLTGGGAGRRSEVRGRERRRKSGLWGQRRGIRVETGRFPERGACWMERGKGGKRAEKRKSLQGKQNKTKQNKKPEEIQAGSKPRWDSSAERI